MKILWLVNLIMPELAEHLGEKPTVFGGWLVGAMNAVRASENELIVCAVREDKCERYELNGVTYYICGTEKMKPQFENIISTEAPDIVHIYGTEFAQSWEMAQAAPREKTLVTIQGAMNVLKDIVYADIPERICRDNLMHKMLRAMHKGGISMELQKKSFDERAALEKKVLSRTMYINGGSQWGNRVAKEMNPDATVLDCNLILRDSFYCSERWTLEDCERHSIYTLFSYPIKGFHKFLEALPRVVEAFPDTRVYVVANTLPLRNYTGIKKTVQNAAQDYNWYVQNKIEELNLKEHISFVGHLSETDVKQRMLKSHVFVSASIMENQSTSLGEAMILGAPSVASAVGAVPEMIDDGVDGFLYDFADTDALADRIIRIFEDDDLAQRFSEKGHEHAARTYDRETNCRKLLEMYETINKNTKENEP